MSARMNLKTAGLSALFLLAAACGDDHKSSSARQPEQNAVCEGIECLSAINWKIFLAGQNFPDRARVDVNGLTVLDECMGKQQYRIDRSSSPQSLFLESYHQIPRRGQVKIQILDQGHDCSHETTVLLNDNVNFEVVKSEQGSEVVINL